MKGYWWFRGESVKALVEQLTTHGVETARLEVRIDDGDAMTFRVVPATADAGKNGEVESTDSHENDINDSHRCPPLCPD